ncbi:MAG: glutaminase [Proteobacteria bacterium]|nr:MAG: glutaminase [Pseudomonadota bacterium]
MSDKSPVISQGMLDEIAAQVRPLIGKGRVADYIPALARVDPDRFAMSVHTIDGREYSVGYADERFSIQSISKILTLTLAMKFVDENLWRRVGRNPSGTSFNSLVQIEHERGIPRNPFINAGAMVVTDCVVSHTADPLGLILNFARHLAKREDLDFDLEVAESERTSGHRNVALAYLIKSFGNIYNDVEKVLAVYFRHCSLAMSCQELGRAFLFLANEGVDPPTGESVLSAAHTRRINSLMQSCGMYEAVGEFAYRVGLPGKSGVGGGLVAVVPRRMTICVWSPELDPVGNSLAGVRAMELFVNRTGTSVF